MDSTRAGSIPPPDTPRSSFICRWIEAAKQIYFYGGAERPTITNTTDGKGATFNWVNLTGTRLTPREE